MKSVFAGACAIACLASPASAQQPPATQQTTPAQQAAVVLDQRCPIPYTVARQSTVLEAYARVSLRLASAMPLTNSVTTANLNAFYSNVRTIIAGEAQQAMANVRIAYVCRLKNTLPQNKHAHVDLMAAEMSKVTLGAFLQGNFADFNSVAVLTDALDARAAAPLPGWDAIPAANRVTRAEVEAAVGRPDFVSRTVTRAGFEASLPVATAGVCRGTVQATLAAVDNSTIASLDSVRAIFANLAADGDRAVAYNDIATAASGAFQPGSSAQIGSQVAGANATARTQTQSCMQTASATVIQNINQSVTTTVPPAGPATTPPANPPGGN